MDHLPGGSITYLDNLHWSLTWITLTSISYLEHLASIFLLQVDIVFHPNGILILKNDSGLYLYE